MIEPRFARPDLLVIDELAYLSYDDDAADLLYELVSRRYERHSIVITTNVQRQPLAGRGASVRS